MKLLHRLIFFLVLVPVGLAVVVFGILNREPVEVDLLIARLSLPLSFGILGGLGAGILLGLLIAWISSGGWRRRARLGERRVTKLEGEVEELRRRTDAGPPVAGGPPASAGAVTPRQRAVLSDS